MKSTIDQETYQWLSKVLLMLGSLLLLVNVFLYFQHDPSLLSATRLSTFTFFLLGAVFVWVRMEYLKAFSFATYKARQVPMWASLFVFIAFAFSRLF